MAKEISSGSGSSMKLSGGAATSGKSGPTGSGRSYPKGKGGGTGSTNWNPMKLPASTYGICGV
jgi:hypothetical protein